MLLRQAVIKTKIYMFKRKELKFIPYNFSLTPSLVTTFLYENVFCNGCISESRTTATYKMELVIIVNGFQLITKNSILDVGVVIDPPLASNSFLPNLI